MADLQGHYWERCRRGAAPWIIGAIGLAGLGAVQLMPVRHRVENDLRARSHEALEAVGLSGVQAEFTGQDGVLKGSVASATDVEKALDVVRSLDGVRIARSELTVAGGATPSGSSTSASPLGTPTPTPTETGTAVPTPTETGAVIPTPAESSLLTPTPTETTAPSPTTAPTPTPAPEPTGTPTATPTPAVTAPTPEARTLAAAEVRRRLTALPPIRFGHGGTRLSTSARRATAEAAAVLASSPSLKVRVQGFTDDTGGWDVNLTISTARAAAVRAALIAGGVPANRISIVGFSEERPTVPNTSAANRAANRRVELVVS
ncbi:MAG: hypothetical protein QG622_1106 [Actinomycetota bacterium]|nr:hypothetical protein [Actinomycetota bacterium]